MSQLQGRGAKTVKTLRIKPRDLQESLDKKTTETFVKYLNENYYVPASVVSDILSISQLAVENAVKRGDLSGTKLAAGQSMLIATESLKNYLIVRKLYLPGFNCPSKKGWTAENFDVLPRDKALSNLTEMQANAILFKIANTFNTSEKQTGKTRLKNLVKVINDGLTAVTLTRTEDEDTDI